MSSSASSIVWASGLLCVSGILIYAKAVMKQSVPIATFGSHYFFIILSFWYDFMWHNDKKKVTYPVLLHIEDKWSQNSCNGSKKCTDWQCVASNLCREKFTSIIQMRTSIENDFQRFKDLVLLSARFESGRRLEHESDRRSTEGHFRHHFCHVTF